MRHMSGSGEHATLDLGVTSPSLALDAEPTLKKEKKKKEKKKCIRKRPQMGAPAWLSGLSI